MRDPNFLIIGAQKGDTTWLWQMLRPHPEVFLAEGKELHFFNKPATYAKGIEWYRAHFESSGPFRAVGEATPNYLWTMPLYSQVHEETSTLWDIPGLVAQHYPDIKLIVSLREPVDRAVSAYYHYIRARWIAPTTRILRVLDQYGILSMGFYYSHLTQWLRYFQRDQFLILIYEDDIKHRKEETLQRVYRFLGVNPAFRPSGLEKTYNTKKHNLALFLNYYSPRLARKIQRFPWLCKFQFPRPNVTSEERSVLRRRYQREILQLEQLLERPLTSWQTEKLNVP